MITTYIGIGSNLSNPVRQVQIAIDHLKEQPSSRLLSQSPLYRSKPVGPQNQPDYINAVCAIETLLLPEELLSALQGIERAQGRERRGER